MYALGMLKRRIVNCEAMEAVVKQRQDLARRRTVVEEERLARDRTRARSMARG